MLPEFEGFDIKGFFTLESEVIAVNFLVILFMPRARIFEKALLVSLGASIFIGLIFSLDTFLN